MDDEQKTALITLENFRKAVMREQDKQTALMQTRFDNPPLASDLVSYEVNIMRSRKRLEKLQEAYTEKLTQYVDTYPDEDQN